jgi:hypothetical protein
MGMKTTIFSFLLSLLLSSSLLHANEDAALNTKRFQIGLDPTLTVVGNIHFNFSYVTSPRTKLNFDPVILLSYREVKELGLGYGASLSLTYFLTQNYRGFYVQSGAAARIAPKASNIFVPEIYNFNHIDKRETFFGNQTYVGYEWVWNNGISINPGIGFLAGYLKDQYSNFSADLGGKWVVLPIARLTFGIRF